LLNIERAGRGVLREVRWLVGVLRDRPDSVTIGDLAVLADAGRNAGFAVQLTMDGNLAAVPPQVVETAYRIVQEGLTNAFRYSGCEQVEVHVEADDDLEVTVLDDGAGGPAADGHGIRGMRERAATVGGEICAGPRNDAPGWQVRATLPLRRERR
jgi:signal transduction histidine kinase